MIALLPYMAFTRPTRHPRAEVPLECIRMSRRQLRDILGDFTPAFCPALERERLLRAAAQSRFLA